MTNGLSDKTSYFVFTTTTAAAICSLALIGDMQLPTKEYSVEPLSLEKYSYENITLNPYYSFKRSASEILDEIKIIHQFSTNIIESSEDLDPSISQIVHKNFWDLI